MAVIAVIPRALITPRLSLALAVPILLIAVGRISGACRTQQGGSVVMLQQAIPCNGGTGTGEVAPLVLVVLAAVCTCGNRRQCRGGNGRRHCEHRPCVC